jgi:hypothetical protein
MNKINQDIANFALTEQDQREIFECLCYGYSKLIAGQKQSNFINTFERDKKTFEKFIGLFDITQTGQRV